MIPLLKKLFVGYILMLSILPLSAQSVSLSLVDCQKLAVANYPLIRKQQLIALSRDYSIANASKAYLPQFSISGQATYQSAVTSLPIEVPGMAVPRPPKDQYRIYGELQQKVFDGGAVRQQKDALEAASALEEQALEVSLYQLKERINQLFFGILTLDEQLKQNGLLQQDIRQGLDKTTAAVSNGTALKSEADLLQAELLKTRQNSTELHAARDAYVAMLGQFTARALDNRTVFEKPPLITPAADIQRPELDWYDRRLKSLDVQEKGVRLRNLPRLDLFIQGGYGRPALNMLQPDPEAYYLGGLRLNWNFASLYTSRNDRALIEADRRQTNIEREVFLFNTALKITEERAEISRNRELLRTDDEIIALRQRIKQAALAKLENGVINTSDYLREVHAEDQARISRILHEVRLLHTLYNYQTTTGNTEQEQSITHKNTEI